MAKGKVILVTVLSTFVLCVPSFAESNFWESTTGAEGAIVFSFATASDGTILSATSRGILRSSNLGRVWVSFGFTGSCRSVAVDSSGRLFTGDISGVFRSVDNGATWSQVLSTKEHLPDSSWSLHTVTSIVILNQECIEAGTNGAGIHRSTDHGLTWSRITSGLTNNDIYSLNRSTSGIVYAGTKDGVFRSLDNGATWAHRPPVRDFAYATVSGSDQDVFAGVSYTVGGSGVYRSTNAGDTWTAFGLQSFPIIGLAIDDRGNLLAAVDNDWNPANNGVYRTTSASGTWTHVTSGLTSLYCRALTILGDGTALVGTEGAGIFRSHTPLTAVEDPTTLPSSIALMQNFPNPFNPSTTIEFDLPRSSHVSLSVYDMLGRQVAVLIDEVKEAARIHTVFDAAGLSSGVYFYRLRTPGLVLTRKMVVQK